MEWSIALSATNDAAKVSLELGHAKAGIVFAHYRELVTPELVQRFWSILPE
jgi:hypothetical protein